MRTGRLHAKVSLRAEMWSKYTNWWTLYLKKEKQPDMLQPAMPQDALWRRHIILKKGFQKRKV